MIPASLPILLVVVAYGVIASGKQLGFFVGMDLPTMTWFALVLLGTYGVERLLARLLDSPESTESSS